MIDDIISSLVSGAASEAGEAICKQVAKYVQTLLRGKPAPEAATQAVAKLEAGTVDEPALRAALKYLDELELSKIRDELDSLRSRIELGSQVATITVSGTVTGTTITGISNTINSK
jgi:hypothetical protein